MNTNHKNSKKTSLVFPEHVGEIINSVHEPLLVLDQDLHVKLANNAFCRFFKVKAREVLGKCIYQLNDKQWNIPKLRKLLEEILAKNSCFCDFKMESDFPRIGKRTISLNAVKIICSSDNRESIFLAFEDVGKREECKNLGKELKKFKMAVDAATHLIITDPDDKILYANKGVKVVTGYDPKEMIGKSSGKLWGGNMPKKFYKDMWNTIYREKKVFRGEVQNKRKNGESYTAEIVITPILDSKRNVEFFVGTEHDITKLRELDRMKSEFISLASHQLREPITAIKWFAELLSKNKQYKLNEEQRGYIHGIIVSNERSIRLVSDLLNLSRIEMGHNFDILAKEVNVVPIIKGIVKEERVQALQKNVTIMLKGDCNKRISVFADADKIRFVFQNVIANAVKYSKLGGKVVIGCKKTAKNILFHVKDNGIGISAVNQKYIFQKFFRAKNAIDVDTNGTGLGLYIAKAIVEGHKGRIWVKSEENSGTTFYISLPR